MKRILLIFAVFTLAITALHAQVADPILVDPAVQAAVNAAVPAQYAGYTSLALIVLMWVGRGIKALMNGGGIKGFFSSIWFGTNTPHILIACLALLTLPSCSFLSSTTGRQVVVSLAEIGLKAAVDHGKLSSGDALTISHGVAVVTEGDTAKTKIIRLGELGLQTAVEKGLVKPGDAVLIHDATAVITQAIQAEPVVPAADLTSGK